MFRAYSAERRDRAPIIETEDFREEGARRFWDDFSPPYFGSRRGRNDTWRDGYLYTSESFALAGIKRYWAYWRTASPTPIPRIPSGPATLDLLHRRGRRRPAGFQRSLPRQRQGGRDAPAQGDLLCPPRDAERAARPAHPRPLELSGHPARRTKTARPSTSSPTPSRSSCSSTASPPA